MGGTRKACQIDGRLYFVLSEQMMRNTLKKVRCGLMAVILAACICFAVCEKAAAAGDTAENTVKGQAEKVLSCYIGPADRYPLCYRDMQGELAGELIDLTELLSEELDVTIEPVMELELDEVYEQLSDGRLDLALGIPDLGILERGLIATACIYREKLVGVILETSRNEAEDRIHGYYWGIGTGLESLAEDTPYASHTVEMLGEAELFSALRNADVYGILLEKSRIDHMLLVEKKGLKAAGTMLKVYEGPVAEYGLFGVLGSSLSADYSEKLLKAVSEYALENINDAGDSRTSGYAEYANLTSKRQCADSKDELIIIILSTLLAVMLILTAVLLRKLREAKAQAKTESRLLQQESTDRALFKVDMKKGTIYNSAGFLCLGFVKGEMESRILLEDLSRATGFDYISHYEKLAAAGEGDFETRYILYRNGKKQYITETGTVKGDRITSVLSNISNNK